MNDELWRDYVEHGWVYRRKQGKTEWTVSKHWDGLWIVWNDGSEQRCEGYGAKRKNESWRGCGCGTDGRGCELYSLRIAGGEGR